MLLPLLQRPGLTLGENLFVVFSPRARIPAIVTSRPGAFPASWWPRRRQRSGSLALYQKALEQVIPVLATPRSPRREDLENTYLAAQHRPGQRVEDADDRLGIDIWR